jgi:hypothetical protein
MVWRIGLPQLTTLRVGLTSRMRGDQTRSGDRFMGKRLDLAFVGQARLRERTGEIPRPTE